MITDSDKRAKETRIGGSDAPIILGLSPFTSREELYYIKAGIIEKENIDNKENVRIGKKIEAFIREIYESESGNKVICVDEEEYTNEKYPWAVAHIDGIIESEKYGKGVFEAKNTSFFMAEHWKNGPPIMAVVQLLHYIAICDLQWGAIAGLIGGNSFKYYEIHRTPEIEQAIAELMDREESFYASVIAQVVPENRPLDLINKLWPEHIEGKLSKIDAIALPQKFNPMLGYLECKNLISEIEKLKDLFEGEIKDVMKDDEMAIYCDNNEEVSCVTWKKSKDSTIVDSDKLKEKYPDAYHDCLKPKKGSRRFSVKLAKGVTLSGVDNKQVRSLLAKIVKGE